MKSVQRLRARRQDKGCPAEGVVPQGLAVGAVSVMPGASRSWKSPRGGIVA